MQIKFAHDRVVADDLADRISDGHVAVLELVPGEQRFIDLSRFVLRGGALFVPSSTVHVLRPHDGSRIGEGLRCELVPDWIRVDERGWVFVAEESGHVNAHAPVPHLELVRS